ncbi:MAG: hypothetical protein JWP81_2965 [Ferruginibacter sp.]|nr:hypothetical protein [Ferruginibacter sp.]
MSRKLEKFIGDHRNEFDDMVPSGKVWESLSAEFEPKKKKGFILTNFYKWSIAAAILVTTGISIFLTQDKNKTIESAAVTTIGDTTNDISTIAPEYAVAVNQFAKQVALKQEELKALAPEQPELYRKFTTDVDQLDSSYISLKNKLGATPNREMLVEAMIQNLQLQLNVLNQQLNIIHQIKQSKSNRHEKNNDII